MKLELQYDESTQVVSEPIAYDRSKNYYYVRYRKYILFGLIGYWQYVLHDTPMGKMYRPFYSMRDVDYFIRINFENYLKYFV